jgi:hypothetical protein
MIKTELNSCTIYVIGEHMVAVTLLYLTIGMKTVSIHMQPFGVRALFFVQVVL